MGLESVVPDFREEGSGFPVCMIPGMEGAWRFWEPQLKGLSRDYRLIACELPRFPLRLRLGMEDYAEAILRRLDLLGVREAVFIGESFGGMVCQHLALRFPRRVAALVLCNTMPGRRYMGFGLNSFTAVTLTHNLAFLPWLGESARRRLLNWVGRRRGFVMDPSPGNDRLVTYLMRYGASHGATGYIDRLLAAAFSDYSGELGSIEVPTLILRGSEDRLVRAEAALTMLWKIPGARLAVVEGGGHCCTFTVPDESNRLIMEWLEGLSLRQGSRAVR